MRLFYLFILVVFGTVSAQASHLYNGQVRYRSLGNEQYELEVELQSNCSSTGLPGQVSVSISSSCAQRTADLQWVGDAYFRSSCGAVPTSCGTALEPVYRINTYKDTVHIPSTCGAFTVSYSLCCRANYTNLVASGLNAFYLETQALQTVTNQTAKVLGPKHFIRCLNSDFVLPVQATDADGDSLSYRLVPTHYQAGGTIPYAASSSNTNPLGAPSCSFDEVSGVLFVELGAQLLAAVITIEVTEHRAGQAVARSLVEYTIETTTCMAPPPNSIDIRQQTLAGQWAPVPTTRRIEVYATDSLLLEEIIQLNAPQDSLYLAEVYWSATRALASQITLVSLQGRADSLRLQTAIRTAAHHAGTYTLNIVLKDNRCPLASTHIVRYEVAVLPSTSASIHTDTILVDRDSLMAWCPIFPLGMDTTGLTAQILSLPTIGQLRLGPTPCVFYRPNDTTEAYRNAIVEYCTPNGRCHRVQLTFIVTDAVWAGDMNNDQNVNHYDLLSLGLGMRVGLSGPTRPFADIQFDAEPARNWNSSILGTSIDLKHVDANGDGILNDQDQQSISQNWSAQYVRGSSGHTQGVPLFVEPVAVPAAQTVTLPILLGTALDSVQGAYGLAFSMFYSGNLVDPNSVQILPTNSWLGTSLLLVQKDYAHLGRVDVCLTRHTGRGRDGFGAVAQVQMTIKDDIFRANERLHIDFDHIRLLDSLGQEIPVTPKETQLLITSLKKIALEPLHIAPNPAKHHIRVTWAGGHMQRAVLYNMLGQVVGQWSSTALNQPLSIEHLPPGQYLLEVHTNRGTLQKKIHIF